MRKISSNDNMFQALGLLTRVISRDIFPIEMHLWKWNDNLHCEFTVDLKGDLSPKYDILKIFGYY